MDIINEVRLSVWQNSSRELTNETARIDVDGSIVPTTGVCKEGMDLLAFKIARAWAQSNGAITARNVIWATSLATVMNA